MQQPDYSITDFQVYLEQCRDELNAARKKGHHSVNKLLLDYGKTLGTFPDIWKSKSNQVRGCSTNVYLNIMLVEDRVFISGHSDAELVKGQLAILINGLNRLETNVIINHVEGLLLNFISNTQVRFSMTVNRTHSLGTLFKFIQSRVTELSGK